MEDNTKIVEPEIVEPDDQGDMIMGGTSMLLILAVFFIGGTLATGIITGLVSAIGVGFLLYKTRLHKPKVWNTMLANPLGTDVLISGAFIFLLAPATATGVIAGCSAAVFSSCFIGGATRFLGPVEGIGVFKLPNLSKVKKVGLNYDKGTEVCPV